MKVRTLDSDDYNTLVKWWEDWGWDAPSKELLPDSGTGGLMVSNDDEEDICAGFLYQTNSKIAWCEFVISDRYYKKSDRSKAIELLIKAIGLTAKEQGYKALFTSLNHQGLINTYERCGFIKSSKNCVEMVMKLN